jgi:hypothetical protein
MGAYGAPDAAIAGMVVGVPNAVESALAKEDIAYGSPVFGPVGVENVAYGPHKNVATLTVSAELVASDTYNVTINGELNTVTFATTHAAAMTALIAAINADAQLVVLGISAAAGTDNKVIVVTGPIGLDLVITTAVVNGGAGTAVASTVYSTNGKFLGAAVFVQNGGKDWGAGDAKWKAGMFVNILADGTLWVPAESTVNDKDAAYAVLGGAGTLGKFTDVATNNYNIGTFFRGNVSGGLAILAVRNMK